MRQRLKRHAIAVMARFVSSAWLAMAITAPQAKAKSEEPRLDAGVGATGGTLIVVSERKESFVPPQPLADGLTEFSLIEMKKIMRLPGEPIRNQAHLTDVRMILKTRKVEDIPNYFVVQAIRGCQFGSGTDGRRTLKELSISREHFGRLIPFKHVGWEIDSDSDDPAYSSFPGEGRLALYRWNRDPNSFDAETTTWWARKIAPHPVVFLTDLPGTAFRRDDRGAWRFAQNTSLEFKSCVFRAQDVPEKTDPKGSNIDFTRAIACHTWTHSYVYDFKQERFESPNSIDSFCLK